MKLTEHGAFELRGVSTQMFRGGGGGGGGGNISDGVGASARVRLRDVTAVGAHEPNVFDPPESTSTEHNASSAS